MTEYTLQSVPMVHTPGIMRYLAEMAKTDRHRALMVLTAGWDSLSQEAYSNLLDGNFTVNETDETVLVRG